MNLTALATRAGLALGVIETRSEPPAEPTTPAGVVPPSRSTQAGVTQATALSLHAVYRAFQILATSASQLSIDGETSAGAVAPSLLRQPSIDQHRSAWIESNVTSLAATGNAFWRIERGVSQAVVSVPVLNPHEVTVLETRGKPARYQYRGTIYDGTEIKHLSLLRVPGTVVGLGPIQSARTDLRSAVDVRDYAAEWFESAGVPSGTLTTTQHLTDEQAETARTQWNAADAGRTRVLGAGLTYTPYLLKPSDAQWLENQKFDVTKVARLFGVPASLMLAAVEGTNLTYSNIEQEWIGFVRFTLMAYLREIEEALSTLLPLGTNARFNVDALLRSDTTTRYAAHEVAIRTGLYDTAHAQRIEGLPITPVKTQEPTA